MALSVTADIVNSNVVGSKRNVPVTLVADNDYPEGGWPISAEDCGLVVLERMIFETGFEDDPEGPAVSFPASFNKHAQTVQAWVSDDTDADDEVADQSSAVDGYVARAIAVGY